MNTFAKGSLSILKVIPQKLTSKFPKTFELISFPTDSEPSSLSATDLWSDGANLYYSKGSTHYVLNGDTWEKKTWNGLSYITSNKCLWSDGTNIYYYSYNGSGTFYILKGDTWELMDWSGLPKGQHWGENFWSDGTNLYYSSGSTQYVLSGNTWQKKTWKGQTSFTGANIWSDGTKIYCSNGSGYTLNGDTWSLGGLGYSKYGTYIWTDGSNLYYSYGNSSSSSQQLMLKNGNWVTVTWNIDIRGNAIYSDSNNIYALLNNNLYRLPRLTPYACVYNRYVDGILREMAPKTIASQVQIDDKISLADKIPQIEDRIANLEKEVNATLSTLAKAEEVAW